MQGDTKLLINASRAASRYLQRDVCELENLQNSSKAIEIFCQKSRSKAIELLQNSLSDYFDQLIFEQETVINNKKQGRIVLIELLDGFDNFSRSLPYFAIMLSLVVNDNDRTKTHCSVINFPALGEIYYAEQGKGAWVEQLIPQINGARRLRIREDYNPANILVASAYATLSISQKISSNIRLFESYTYSFAQLLRGRIDILVTPKQNLSIDGTKLFLSEAGGACNLVKNNLIAANFKLSAKINTLLA